MIHGLFHEGSGLGDQLFCYLAARSTAERLGVPFTMVGKFKGENFMTIGKGAQVEIPHHVEYPAGKIVLDYELPLFEGKRWYDPEFNFVEDETIIDGCMMQDERYFDLSKIRQWLQVEPWETPDDTCAIGFRGGEYATVPELFLTKDYWIDAIELMRVKGITKFAIHTDDAPLASQFFLPILGGGYSVTQNTGINWRAMRYAKHAIIANSAFYIIPRLLSGAITIAPRFWARRNIKEWSLPQNYYKSFFYI